MQHPQKIKPDVEDFPFPLLSLAMSRQNPGLSTPHHQCQVSMPSPTFGVHAVAFGGPSAWVFRYQS